MNSKMTSANLPQRDKTGSIFNKIFYYLDVPQMVPILLWIQNLGFYVIYCNILRNYNGPCIDRIPLYCQWHSIRRIQFLVQQVMWVISQTGRDVIVYFSHNEIHIVIDERSFNQCSILHIGGELTVPRAKVLFYSFIQVQLKRNRNFASIQLWSHKPFVLWDLGPILIIWTNCNPSMEK